MSANQYDVLFLGAGASGLMTAYMAAQRGRKVVVVNVTLPICMSSQATLFHIIHTL